MFNPARQASAKAVGINLVRYFLDLAPYMDVLQGGALTSIEYLLGNFLAMAQQIRAAGFKQIVNLNLEVHGPLWNRDDAMDGPTGPVFTLFKEASRIVAAALVEAGFTPKDIALTTFNEPNTPETFAANGWPSWGAVLQPALHANLREVMPDHTIIIQPWALAWTGAVNTLHAADYDRNTIIDVHPYGPFDWAHQGVGSYKNMRGIPYNVAPAEREAMRAAIHALVDADETLNAGQRSAQKALYDDRIDSIYFASNPFGSAYMANLYATMYGHLTANGWSGRNLGFGEWNASVHTDAQSRAQFLTDGFAAARQYGFGFAVVWENGGVGQKPFGIHEGNAIVPGIAETIARA